MQPLKTEETFSYFIIIHAKKFKNDGELYVEYRLKSRNDALMN